MKKIVLTENTLNYTFIFGIKRDKHDGYVIINYYN